MSSTNNISSSTSTSTNNSNIPSQSSSNSNSTTQSTSTDPTTIGAAVGYMSSMVSSSYHYWTGTEGPQPQNEQEANENKSNNTKYHHDHQMHQNNANLKNMNISQTKNNSYPKSNPNLQISQSQSNCSKIKINKSKSSLSGLSKSKSAEDSPNGNYSNKNGSYQSSPTPPSRSTSYSNLGSVLDSINQNGIDVPWTKKMTEPLSKSVSLRSITYKINGKKQVCTQPMLFRLCAAQAFKIGNGECIDNIAQNPVSWYSQNISPLDRTCFLIIIHLQVKSIKSSFITYHILNNLDPNKYNKNGTPQTNDNSFNKLFDIVLSAINNKNKTELNNRMKLVPRVVSGPYPVKKVVENRPVLLGNKVPMNYYRGNNYMEIDAKVDESLIAGSIIKLCHTFARRIVVDMAWTIQGEEMDELPERLLCGVTIHNMDFNKCKDINTELFTIKNKQKIKYNKEQNNNNNNQEEEKQNK